MPVLEGHAPLNDGPRAVGSVWRAVGYGLTAGVAGAGLYTTIAIVTGYELGLVAILMGLGVGLAVAAGHAGLAEGWVRALSVVLTLFSLLLSSYLVLWLYNDQGFEPVPISVGDAATLEWESKSEEPWLLLAWGLALLTASGVGKAEHPVLAADPDAEPSPLTVHHDAPPSLVERPRVRLYWCAGALVLAVSSAVMGFAARDELGGGGGRAFFDAALVLTVLAVACLRWSIVADESGLTVTNLVRRHRIPWRDLEDVKLEEVQADLDLGFHFMVFVTHAGKRIRADAPTGRNRPGGRLEQLQETLLDMRNRYAPRR